MLRKRTLSAPMALALDGSLLLNASGQIAPALLAKVADALAVRPRDLFIGTRLPPAQRTETLNRFDDAAAEAAARIHGLAGARPAPAAHRRAAKKSRSPR